MNRNYLITSFLTLIACLAMAQPSFQGKEHLFVTPKHYVACYTTEKIVIDGRISEKEWDHIPWSDYFKDIEGEDKAVPRYNTRMKMLWDNDYLYVAAQLDDPHVWAYLKKHDEVVYYDNDFEVFIDPDNNTHQYFEIEVNAQNTIFDLFMPKPYRNGSGALISWDASGLKSAVNIRGTLNNPTDTDQGWAIEMAIPFAAVTIGNNPDIPQEGKIWRINFSRVEWQTEISGTEYIKKKNPSGKVIPEDNWVWSPQGVIDMHRPERWGYLLFTRQTNCSKAPQFELPYEEKQKQYLWLVYYLQQDFREKNQRYALSLEELGINQPEFELEGKLNTLNLESTNAQFVVFIRQEGNHHMICVNQEGLVIKK